MHIPAELQVVREEEIREVRLLAFDLRAFLDLGEIEAHVLRLDVAKSQAVFSPRNLIIGGTALFAFGSLVASTSPSDSSKAFRSGR